MTSKQFATYGEFEYEWHSTPQLWIATRAGLCQCQECLVYGTGKTKEAALADLLEKEECAA